MYKYRTSNKYLVYSHEKKQIEQVKKNVIKNQVKYYKFLHPDWVQFAKDIEIGYIAPYLSKNQKILEIGSGEGYAANVLQNKYGLDVTASDLEPRYPQYTEVLKVDGQSTAFQDKQYDVIISFHVLEHIEDIDMALEEFKRLLKDDGIMYHIVPSRFNMFLTTIEQPLAYIRSIYLYLNGYYVSKYQPFKNKNILRFIKSFFTTINPLNIFWGAGHGVYNRLDCFRFWSIPYWSSIFHKNNLEVIEVHKSNFSNSMHKMFPFKFIKLRKFIAKIGGGSANLFIIRKKD